MLLYDNHTIFIKCEIKSKKQLLIELQSIIATVQPIVDVDLSTEIHISRQSNFQNEYFAFISNERTYYILIGKKADGTDIFEQRLGQFIKQLPLSSNGLFISSAFIELVNLPNIPHIIKSYTEDTKIKKKLLHSHFSKFITDKSSVYPIIKKTIKGRNYIFFVHFDEHSNDGQFALLNSKVVKFIVNGKKVFMRFSHSKLSCC